MAHAEAEEEERPWSHAPELILSNIGSRLLGRDAIVFPAVCKAWNRFAIEEGLSLSPCLVFPDSRLFHPLRNLFFRLKTTPTFPKGVILAQNHGWWLMTAVFRPFFFNPFTSQRINLPDWSLLFKSVTFSSPPTSQDCEMLTFKDYEDGDQAVVAVETMKRGETGFHTVHTASTPRLFDFLHNSRPIFHRGEFYCFGKEGNMVIYNSKTDELRIIDSPMHLWAHFSASDSSHYMFECKLGDLWAVFVACRGGEVCVLKLDSTAMIWGKVEDLEDRTVFVSRTICFMERSKVRGTGNRIYFPRFRDEKCLFYCLATKRYCTMEGSTNCYQSFHNSKEMARSSWIKLDVNPPPPQTLACDEELVW